MKRGYTLMEALLTMAIVIAAFIPLICTFLMSSRQSVHSRYRALANVLLYNLQQEIREHRYGAPRPASWGPPDADPRTGAGMVEEVVPAALEGRRADMRFFYSVKTAPQGNGSFFGLRSEPSDVLQIDVRWTEASGVSHSSVTRRLHTEMTVWGDGSVAHP